MVQQSITLFQLIQFIGIIASIIFTGFGISRQIKKNYHEYVDSKMDVVNLQIKDLKSEVRSNKQDNQREHDAIKKEFLDRVNMIFEWIKSKSN